jgi:hypothetical protein
MKSYSAEAYNIFLKKKEVKKMDNNTKKKG